MSPRRIRTQDSARRCLEFCAQVLPKSPQIRSKSGQVRWKSLPKVVGVAPDLWSSSAQRCSADVRPSVAEVAAKFGRNLAGRLLRAQTWAEIGGDRPEVIPCWDESGRTRTKFAPDSADLGRIPSDISRIRNRIGEGSAKHRPGSAELRRNRNVWARVWTTLTCIPTSTKFGHWIPPNSTEAGWISAKLKLGSSSPKFGAMPTNFGTTSTKQNGRRRPNWRRCRPVPFCVLCESP